MSEEEGRDRREMPESKKEKEDLWQLKKNECIKERKNRRGVRNKG